MEKYKKEKISKICYVMCFSTKWDNSSIRSAPACHFIVDKSCKDLVLDTLPSVMFLKMWPETPKICETKAHNSLIFCNGWESFYLNFFF